MSTDAQLPQDAALLDLISAAAAAPEAVRERAHALAAIHAVAPPEQVERALTKVLPASGSLAWDRPRDPADREARGVAYQESVAQVNREVQKKKRRFLPNSLNSGVFGTGAVFLMVAALIRLFDHYAPSMWNEMLNEKGAGLFGVYLVVTFLPFFLGMEQEINLDRIVQRHEPELEKGKEQLRQMAPYKPTADQMARWLTHPEVAQQARIWTASACGLMVGDAEGLDARVAQLDSEKAEAVRLELAQQLGITI